MYMYITPQIVFQINVHSIQILEIKIYSHCSFLLPSQKILGKKWLWLKCIYGKYLQILKYMSQQILQYMYQ